MNFKVIEGDRDKEYKDDYELYEKTKKYIDKGYSLPNAVKQVSGQNVQNNSSIVRRVKKIFQEEGYVCFRNHLRHEDKIIDDLDDLLNRLNGLDGTKSVKLYVNGNLRLVDNVFFDGESYIITSKTNTLHWNSRIHNWEVV